MTNEIANNIKLDNGNLPYQVYVNGECHWAYRIEESVSVDDGTGNTAFITIYQETRYLKGNAEAREWYDKHPRNSINRDDYANTDLLHLHRNGAWSHVF